MSMADIITLSSSPPTIFARSPTPVTLSSSPRKTRDKFSSYQETASNDFKPAQTARDGFPTAFTTARQVLGAKSSAENLPFASPTPLKLFPKDASTTQPAHPVSGAAVPRLPAAHNLPDAGEVSKGTVIQILPSDVRRTKKIRNNTCLNLEKAATRRADWTPPKPTSLDSKTTDPAGFGMKLQQSFGHVSPATSFSVEGNTGNKRRKIDSITLGSRIVPGASGSFTKSAKSASKTRNKSPTKKTLTITGLTTSHYMEEEPDQDNSTLMMQFLASTQARMQSDGGSEMFETSIKSANSKNKKSKSRLRSPRTSIKTINEQDIVFASASQLVRDESPTLLRDTAEAIRQSEEDSFNESGLTQQTVLVSSAPVSPDTGVTRYRGRKNLWCAAHRDENDALLHRDDLFDEPGVRAALVGRDALIQDVGQVQAACSQVDDSLGLLATLNNDSTMVCDIDDLVTPLRTSNPVPTVAKRMYSTSSQTPSKRMTASPPPSENPPHEAAGADADSQGSKIPPKPNYASWTDEQLKDQVKEHGFKRLRARKSMIDKLDEYWAQKYGLDVAAVKAATKAASKQVIDRDHAHFLSKVHELAPRPQPKTSKSRSKKGDTTPFVGISKTKSKSKLVKVQEGSAATEESIFDIDEIDNTTALERLASIKPFPDEVSIEASFEPSTAPVKGTGVKAAAKPKKKRKNKAIERPLTPPPTMPEDLIQDSSPGFASPRSKARAPITTLVMEDEDTSLKSHIRTALLNPVLNTSTRNHQKNPSWHEKILLYDPIVLEDFTAWLNTEGFNAIGIDDEIDAKEVKAWCEENGICCLWKGGWRGNKVKE